MLDVPNGPGSAGGRDAAGRAAEDRPRALRHRVAEHTELLRTGPVRPVPPDRRDPAPHCDSRQRVRSRRGSARERGADPDVAEATSATPLHYAAAWRPVVAGARTGQRSRDQAAGRDSLERRAREHRGPRRLRPRARRGTCHPRGDGRRGGRHRSRNPRRTWSSAWGWSNRGTAFVNYADERRDERPLAGPVTVRIGNRAMVTHCVVGPPLSEPLIGQVVLETLDVIADCTNRTLTPRYPD